MDPDREYYLIHEARYKRILEEIERIASTRQRINASTSDTDAVTHRRNDAPFRILDVGCYPYHLGAELEKAGHDVWGISSEHEPIKNRKVAILNIETDPFPYKDNFFDLTLCSEVLEHLPHSPVPALKEMYRVTRPGGHLLVTTPNIIRSINRGKILLGKSPIPPIEPDISIYHRHNHEYTLDELSTTIARASWRITRATHFISYSPFRTRNRRDHPLLWTGKFANFLAMKIAPRLQDTLLIIASK